MAVFIKSKDNKLINLYYVQNIVINPENDKEIIIYNKNGESIIESYDTAEEASTAYDNYVTKMEESSGGGGSKLQIKSVTITENGTSTITPDEGYGGISKVNLDVDVENDYNVKINTAFTSNLDNITKNIVEIQELDLSNLTNSRSMFANCKSLASVTVKNTSNITDMYSMFSGCECLEAISLFDTSNVTNMESMFNNCTSLTEIPLFDVSNATNLTQIFRGCSNLTTIPVLNPSKATTMQGMFSGCSKLTNESLNNILQICLNATSYNGTKTLYQIGLSSSQATTCTTLSNWDALEAEGWTKGY